MRASHCKNVRGAVDERRRERLTAQLADVYAFFRANLYRVETWRLAAHRVYTGRENVYVLTIANQTTKKPFRDRAATNITCADKEDAFHGSRWRERVPVQPRSEPAQVNSEQWSDGFSAVVVWLPSRAVFAV